MNLLIDTHFNDIVVMLFDNENNIVKEKIITEEKQNSKFLMPAIKKILNKQTPDSILVINGPGSFTGVRLGVTSAKTLAYTLNIPIKAITSLKCLALSTDEENKIIGFSDNNGYYIGIFTKECEIVGDYEYLSKKEFEEYSKKYSVLTDIKIDYKKVCEYSHTIEPVNPHEVNPIYIKKLDVEK